MPPLYTKIAFKAIYYRFANLEGDFEKGMKELQKEEILT